MTTTTLLEPTMRALPRNTIIAAISFLTLVDLFAAQAILPSLASSYGATPAEIGVAVNASTFGMAGAGLAVALLARRIDRRNGIWVSLVLLSIPTFLLSSMPELGTFAVLRVLQGVFMASAFTLTMAYIAEHGSAATTAGALAAYVSQGLTVSLSQYVNAFVWQFDTAAFNLFPLAVDIPVEFYL